MEKTKVSPNKAKLEIKAKTPSKGKKTSQNQLTMQSNSLIKNKNATAEVNKSSKTINSNKLATSTDSHLKKIIITNKKMLKSQENETLLEELSNNPMQRKSPKIVDYLAKCPCSGLKSTKHVQSSKEMPVVNKIPDKSCNKTTIQKQVKSKSIIYKYYNLYNDDNSNSNTNNNNQNKSGSIKNLSINNLHIQNNLVSNNSNQKAIKSSKINSNKAEVKISANNKISASLMPSIGISNLSNNNAAGDTHTNKHSNRLNYDLNLNLNKGKNKKSNSNLFSIKKKNNQNKTSIQEYKINNENGSFSETSEGELQERCEAAAAKKEVIKININNNNYYSNSSYNNKDKPNSDIQLQKSFDDNENLTNKNKENMNSFFNPATAPHESNFNYNYNSKNFQQHKKINSNLFINDSIENLKAIELSNNNNNNGKDFNTNKMGKQSLKKSANQKDAKNNINYLLENFENFKIKNSDLGLCNKSIEFDYLNNKKDPAIQNKNHTEKTNGDNLMTVLHAKDNFTPREKLQSNYSGKFSADADHNNSEKLKNLLTNLTGLSANNSNAQNISSDISKKNNKSLNIITQGNQFLHKESLDYNYVPLSKKEKKSIVEEMNNSSVQRMGKYSQLFSKLKNQLSNINDLLLSKEEEEKIIELKKKFENAKQENIFDYAIHSTNTNTNTPGAKNNAPNETSPSNNKNSIFSLDENTISLINKLSSISNFLSDKLFNIEYMHNKVVNCNSNSSNHNEYHSNTNNSNNTNLYDNINILNNNNNINNNSSTNYIRTIEREQNFNIIGNSASINNVINNNIQTVNTSNNYLKTYENNSNIKQTTTDNRAKIDISNNPQIHSYKGGVENLNLILEESKYNNIPLASALCAKQENYSTGNNINNISNTKNIKNMSNSNLVSHSKSNKKDLADRSWNSKLFANYDNNYNNNNNYYQHNENINLTSMDILNESLEDIENKINHLEKRTNKVDFEKFEFKSLNETIINRLLTSENVRNCNILNNLNNIKNSNNLYADSGQYNTHKVNSNLNSQISELLKIPSLYPNTNEKNIFNDNESNSNLTASLQENNFHFPVKNLDEKKNPFFENESQVYNNLNKNYYSPDNKNHIVSSSCADKNNQAAFSNFNTNNTSNIKINNNKNKIYFEDQTNDIEKNKSIPYNAPNEQNNKNYDTQGFIINNQIFNFSENKNNINNFNNITQNQNINYNFLGNINNSNSNYKSRKITYDLRNSSLYYNCPSNTINTNQVINLNISNDKGDANKDQEETPNICKTSSRFRFSNPNNEKLSLSDKDIDEQTEEIRIPDSVIKSQFSNILTLKENFKITENSDDKNADNDAFTVQNNNFNYNYAYRKKRNKFSFDLRMDTRIITDLFPMTLRNEYSNKNFINLRKANNSNDNLSFYQECLPILK